MCVCFFFSLHCLHCSSSCSVFTKCIHLFRIAHFIVSSFRTLVFVLFLFFSLSRNSCSFLSRLVSCNVCLFCWFIRWTNIFHLTQILVKTIHMDGYIISLLTQNGMVNENTWVDVYINTKWNMRSACSDYKSLFCDAFRLLFLSKCFLFALICWPFYSLINELWYMYHM